MGVLAASSRRKPLPGVSVFLLGELTLLPWIIIETHAASSQTDSRVNFGISDYFVH